MDSWKDKKSKQTLPILLPCFVSRPNPLETTLPSSLAPILSAQSSTPTRRTSTTILKSLTQVRRRSSFATILVAGKNTQRKETSPSTKDSIQGKNLMPVRCAQRPFPLSETGMITRRDTRKKSKLSTICFIIYFRDY
jgi:hypothetical protein